MGAESCPSYRVLIVDDDEGTHQSFREMLKPVLPEAATDELARVFGSDIVEEFFPEFELLHARSGKEAYQKVKEADAVVLGSPIHFGTISATMSAFISRLWGFRHVNFAIKNKPFILAVSGLGEKQHGASDDFRKALKPFLVNVVDVVKYCSRVPPCYRCGRHQECRIGGAYHRWGAEVRNLTITPELFRKWEDCPATVAEIGEAAEKLRNAVLTPS